MGTVNLKTRQQRIAVINAERYVTALVRFPDISSDNLIKYASDASGISKAQMSAAFYAIAQQFEFFILNGHGLEFGHLGKFYLALETDATVDEDDAGASAVRRIVVRFRQSKTLQSLLNNNIVLSTLKSGSTSSTDSGSTTGSGSSTDSGSSSDSGSGSDSGSDSGGDSGDPFDPYGT